MFLGDPTIRSAGEKIEYTPAMLQEYIKCQADIIYFAEKYFKIITIDEGERLIKLWDFQKKMLKAFVDPSPKQHCIVLSSRQIGKSTISTIYLLHYILFNESKTCGILANKEKNAIELLQKVQFAYKNLPLFLQQGVLAINKMSLELENNSRLIASSTSSSAVRSWTFATLFLDEFAFVPKNIADEFLSSVYPTIISGQTSKVIMVSTPNGINHYYDFWRAAVNGENNFKPIRIRWDEVPGRDRRWKEKVIADIGLIKWLSEFEGKFLGTNNTLINPDILERIMARDPIELKYGGLLQIYEAPKEKSKYIMGVDSAKGTGKDYSVIQVLKIDNVHEVEQVAIYRCNTIDIHNFVQIIIGVSKYYNDALAMVENNDVGEAVVNDLFYNFEWEGLVNLDPKGLGIRTTTKTKLSALLILKRYLENGWLEIYDRATLKELSRFEEKTPNIFAASDGNDDTVMALALAVYFLETDYNENRKIDNIIEDKNKIEILKKEEDEDEPTIIIDDGSINIDGFSEQFL